MPSPVALSLEHVRFAYRRAAPVIQDASAQARPGRVTAVVGPNGAGKTTLLRLILGVLTPDQGSVRLDGRPVRRLSARARATRLAYVPQRPAVAFDYSVRQVVAMARLAQDPSPAAVDQALRLVDLAGRADQPLGVLSAGQQQRVALARAVAQLVDPAQPVPRADDNQHPPSRFLLADEPIASQDPAHALAVEALLGDLARRLGVGVLVVLHDLTVARRAADDAWILAGDGSLTSGPAAETLTADRLAPVFRVRLDDARSDALGRPLLTVLSPLDDPATSTPADLARD